MRQSFARFFNFVYLSRNKQMSLALHTIQFNMFGSPYEISLWMDQEDSKHFEQAFHNWSVRTDDYSDYSLAQYIYCKG